MIKEKQPHRIINLNCLGEKWHPMLDVLPVKRKSAEGSVHGTIQIQKSKSNDKCSIGVTLEVEGTNGEKLESFVRNLTNLRTCRK